MIIYKNKNETENEKLNSCIYKWQKKGDFAKIFIIQSL